jgi:hypothetical protein
MEILGPLQSCKLVNNYHVFGFYVTTASSFRMLRSCKLVKNFYITTASSYLTPKLRALQGIVVMFFEEWLFFFF